MKHVFIVNPVSGKEDASKFLIPHINEAANGLDYIIECTAHRGHAMEIAQKYANSGEHVRLYACGGDGTLNEVFAGIYGHDNAEVSCVPCGSGNDFVRNFGEAEDFRDLKDNIDGCPIMIDLMRANGGISAAISSVGIDSDVAYAIPKFRRFPLCGGQMAYTMSIIEQLCSKLGKKVTVEVDGKSFDGNFLLAAVCNGKAYGGGFNAAPTADLQDGLLEVVMVKKISRLRIASVLAKYKNGEHIKDGKVIEELSDILTYFNARKVKITPKDGQNVIANIDGECSSVACLDVEVIPSCARFVLPGKICGKYAVAKLGA
ncbi:MAG: diacylglycerol kinase family lipid kinase [Oscillospiraceae bacterium]